jgi:hypothetical protein
MPVATTTDLESDIIVSAYRHRLLSTSQIHQLHTPDTSERWTRKVLAGLEAAGYLARARRWARAETGTRSGGESLWWVTDMGADAAEGGEVTDRRYRMTEAKAIGPLRAHTLAVNDVGVAFSAAARRLGHECSPADWDHEIAFRVADKPIAGPGSDLLVADAVLHYAIRYPEDDELLSRFIEVDRGTETVQRLAAKLRTYAAVYEYIPRPSANPPPGPRLAAWHTQFLAFPHVLVVLTGLSTGQLRRRRDIVLELCRRDPALERLAGRVTIFVTTLAELTELGPFAPIFSSPFETGPRDLVGDLPGQDKRAAQPAAHGPARHDASQSPGQLRLLQE